MRAMDADRFVSDLNGEKDRNRVFGNPEAERNRLRGWLGEECGLLGGEL